MIKLLNVIKNSDDKKMTKGNKMFIMISVPEISSANTSITITEIEK